MLAVTYTTAASPLFNRMPAVRGVKVDLRAFGNGWVSCRLNPSRLLDPFGASLASVEDALAIATEAWAVVADHAEPEVSLGQSNVSRLDLAVDFHGSSDPDRLLRAVAAVPRTHARERGEYRNPSTGALETVQWGSKSQRLVRVYDQKASKGDLVPAGSLRWELEARKGYLRRRGIFVVDDITNSKVEMIGLGEWKVANMEVQSVDIPTLRGLAKDYAGEVAGARLFFDAIGAVEGEWPGRRQRRAQLRTFFTDCGISLDALPVLPAASPLVERFDLATGTIVTTLTPGLVGAGHD
jgi:hypothetical protein